MNGTNREWGNVTCSVGEVYGHYQMVITNGVYLSYMVNYMPYIGVDSLDVSAYSEITLLSFGSVGGYVEGTFFGRLSQLVFDGSVFITNRIFVTNGTFKAKRLN